MSWHDAEVPLSRKKFQIGVRADDPQMSLCLKYKFEDATGECEVAFSLDIDPMKRQSLYEHIKNEGKFLKYSVHGNNVIVHTPTEEEYNLFVFDDRYKMVPLYFAHVQPVFTTQIGFFHKSTGEKLLPNGITASSLDSVHPKLLDKAIEDNVNGLPCKLLVVPDEVPLVYASLFFPNVDEQRRNEIQQRPVQNSALARTVRTEKLFETLMYYLILRNFYTKLIEEPLKDFQGQCMIDDLCDLADIICWLNRPSDIKFAKFSSLRQSRDLYDLIHESSTVKMECLRHLSAVTNDVVLMTIAFCVRRLLFVSHYLNDVFMGKLDRMLKMPPLFEGTQIEGLGLFSVNEEEVKRRESNKWEFGNSIPPFLRGAYEQREVQLYRAKMQYQKNDLERYLYLRSKGLLRPAFSTLGDNAAARIKLLKNWQTGTNPRPHYTPSDDVEHKDTDMGDGTPGVKRLIEDVEEVELPPPATRRRTGTPTGTALSTMMLGEYSLHNVLNNSNVLQHIDLCRESFTYYDRSLSELTKCNIEMYNRDADGYYTKIDNLTMDSELLKRTYESLSGPGIWADLIDFGQSRFKELFSTVQLSVTSGWNAARSLSGATMLSPDTTVTHTMSIESTKAILSCIMLGMMNVDGRQLASDGGIRLFSPMYWILEEHNRTNYNPTFPLSYLDNTKLKNSLRACTRTYANDLSQPVVMTLNCLPSVFDKVYDVSVEQVRSMLSTDMFTSGYRQDVVKVTTESGRFPAIVVFGNKNPCGGFWAFGSAQEEIVLTKFPLAAGLAVLVPTLQHKTDATTTFRLENVPGPSGSRTLLFMDAPEVYSNEVREQTNPEVIKHLLCKALTSFSSCKEEYIATGDWGCGIFNNNPVVAFIVQLLAAAACDKKLVYCTWNHTLASNADRVIALIAKKESVKDIVDDLLHCSGADHDSVRRFLQEFNPAPRA